MAAGSPASQLFNHSLVLEKVASRFRFSKCGFDVVSRGSTKAYNGRCTHCIVCCLNFFFYCCSRTVVYISTPLWSPTPPFPASHLQTYPLWLCPCVLCTCSLMDLPLFPPIILLPLPLWLLSVCSLFQCFWLYFACLYVLLIRFHL